MSSKTSLSWFLILILAAPIVTGLVLAWLFSCDGTLGLYQWEPEYRVIFIAVGALGLVAPLLALAARFLPRAHRALRILAIVFAILGIVVPVAASGSYLRDSLEFSATTPPMLLLADGTGAHGVPNLALVFRTAPETQNTLSYGEESLSEKIVEARATREHALALKDLKPNTRYQWRLNDGATCAFVTPAVQSNDILYHLGVGGDSHLGAGIAGSEAGDVNVIRSVLKFVTEPANRFNAFFVVGDLVNMGSTNGDWQNAMETLAPFTCGVPLRPLMGNHDAIINGTPHYLAYFYPEGMETPSGTRLYYRIDAGRVHFVTLKMLWGAETFSAEQRAWFAKQMESIPADDWTIVMMHSMAYSSGSVFSGLAWYDPPEMIQQVVPLFEKYQVDLVISGHNHHIEFLQKNGVSYAIVGGLGGKLDPEASYKSPASVWYLPKQYGFLDVTARADSLDLAFRDPNGNELRSFRIGKTR